MTADVYDPVLGLILQATGNNNNAWGTILDNSMITPAARAIAGINTITATGGTVDLSTVVPPAGMRLDIDHIQQATGALVSDLTIIVPAISKTWCFINRTSGAFGMFVKTPGGTSPSGLVQIPAGKLIWVIGDGAGVLFRRDKDEVGNLIHHGGASAPAGTLACDGSSRLRAAFPDLFNIIGTTWGSVDGTHFTLPNFQDTGRFLRSVWSGQPTVGTYLANQNQAHTHTVTGAPSSGTLATDVQGNHSHTATSTDSGHSHPFNATQPGGAGGGSGAPGCAPNNTTPSNTGTGTANITTTLSTAGAHGHNITGAPGLGSLGTATQGGTEARPESATVLICIRY